MVKLVTRQSMRQSIGKIHTFFLGRCLKGIDSRSKKSSELVSIDEESKHKIVPMFGLRKTNRVTHSSLDPRAKLDVFALDFLRIGLPPCVLRGVEMARIGIPPIRIPPRDAKRLSEGFELHKDRVLVSPKDVCEDRTATRIDRVPEPPRVRFAAHVTPHFVQLGHESASLIECF